MMLALALHNTGTAFTRYLKRSLPFGANRLRVREPPYQLPETALLDNRISRRSCSQLVLPATFAPRMNTSILTTAIQTIRSEARSIARLEEFIDNNFQSAVQAIHTCAGRVITFLFRSDQENQKFRSYYVTQGVMRNL